MELKESTENRQYAFLMIDYETPDFIKELQKKIKPSELYIEDDNDYYGIEENSHVTLVPCLDNSVKLDDLKKHLKPLKTYEILLSNISVFECGQYDVLKCDAKSKFLNETNKEITDEFPTYTEYKDYHPHLTIAYLQKGMAEKYKKDIISPLVILKPKNFVFSYHNNDGKESEITFKS